MKRLVECVPNFSEGRRPEIIEAIIKEILSVSEVWLLDKEMDKDHNRAVVTFVGSPESAGEAAFKAIAKATELIDLNKHQGEHPRMGATDVVPFVPVSGVTLEECVLLAQKLGKEVGEKLHIPVYLYEEAATRPDRRNLAEVRKGEFEGLREEIGQNPDRVPDFGPEQIHPTAGAVAIGARTFLIAYNVYLDTVDLNLAKKIAKAIRFSDGGLRYVKALGFEIKERNLVQVSMNLVNYPSSPIFRVFEMVKREAQRYGVNIVSSEIVGLTPMEALIDVADFYLQLENFKPTQILEKKLMELEETHRQSLEDFISSLASSAPTPGGGSASALAGSLAACLSEMVCRLTVGKEKYASVQDKIKGVLSRLEELRGDLYALIEEDSKSFDRVMEAYKLPKTSEEDKVRRKKAVQEATRQATSVPLQIMEKGYEVLHLSKTVAENGNVNALSDAGASASLARSAVESAYLNVKINLKALEDSNFVGSVRQKAQEIKKQAELLHKEIMSMVEDKI